jgi:hypothetical protein
MPTALVGGAARRTAAQADGGRAWARARKGTARVCSDVRVLQGLQGTHGGTHGYSKVLQGTHTVPHTLPRTSKPRLGSRGCTRAARKALHGRHSMAVLKEYHVSHEPCSTNSWCGRVTQHRAARRTSGFVHLGTYGYSTVLTRSVRAPPGTVCKEAHSPARTAAAVLSDCAMH